MGVARTVYVRRAVSCVLSSSSLHATSCILFGISTSSPFPPFPPFPPNLRIGDARLVPPVPVRHVHLILSVLVRHVRPTLSISMSDTSVRRCPSRCPTRPSDVVRSYLTRLSDAVCLCLPFPFPSPFLFPFPFPSCSRSRSRSHFRFPLRFRSHSRIRHQNSLEYLGELPPLH